MKHFTIVLGMIAASAVSASAQAQVAAATTSTIVVSGKYQRDWQRGSQLEAQGLKELAEAQKTRVSYSADVVNAQNKSSNSASLASNASAEFQRLTAQTPSYTTSKDALEWANKVQHAADKWAEFDARGASGKKDLDKATRDQRKAEQAMAKAQAKVDRGRAMKADAERLSLLGS